MKTLTSRELLKKAEANKPNNFEMPLEIRPLVITSVLNFMSAKKLREALDLRKEVTKNNVSVWQKTTRKWLRLPPIGRGKPSKKYKKLVAEWLNFNGNPTPDQIDQGWLPSHLKREKERKLSPRYQAELEETREQMASLKAARSDDERVKLLKEYLKNMGREFNVDDLVVSMIEGGSILN